jgi:hypothetical protein
MSDAVRPLTPAQMQEQEKQLRLALQFDARPGKPHLAHYELEIFVY